MESREISFKVKMDILIFLLIFTLTAVMRVESQQNMAIRLMYGVNSAEGAVFMYRNNRWSPICAKPWTDNEAKVACRQLYFPYPHLKSASLPDYIHVNVSRWSTWMEGFRCSGYEIALERCSYWGWGTCDSGLVAGVKCDNTPYSTNTESGGLEFPSKFAWLGMVIFGAVASFACYKKVRKNQRMRALQTTIHQQASSTLEEPNESPPDIGNQAYPASLIPHHHTAAFNGGNNKNTTYVGLPPSQNQHGQLFMSTAPEEFLTTPRIEGNLPMNQNWRPDTTPVHDAHIISAPPPVGFAPPPAYQIPAPLTPQGFPHYPSQDPLSHDAPPGPPPPPPPTYEEAIQ